AEEQRGPREMRSRVRDPTRPRVLPIWELQFGDLAQGTRPIATEMVKHNIEYQLRHSIKEGPADDLAPPLTAKIQNMVRRVCRTLDLDGYARIDFRLAVDG